eukprot:TRINITY_DN46831_c0_g1_i1.p1 TRINITY_DN46831_c0_g1~~TRINITY_DN46831_c0_g1_i1.p1  ORF type:complete len:846 (+),score=50.07 TRINITY_DN46831_c0_g1_i1:40-2538(+)
MLVRWILFCSPLWFLCSCYEFWGNPVTNPKAVVSVGSNVKFSVLTPHLIRLQYSPTSEFTEDKTTIVWNRNLPVPKFSASTTNGTTTIKTAALTLTYTASTDDTAGFTANNLRIEMHEKNFLNVTQWHPGMSTVGNLYGTIRTLDNIGGIFSLNCTTMPYNPHDEPELCAWGLVSQAGWSLVDDSESPWLDPATNWPRPQKSGQCKPGQQRTECFFGTNPQKQWECEKAGCCWGDVLEGGVPQCFKRVGYIDWYFFGHGSGDYTAALRDFTAISGPVPLPRRHMFGVAWSKWQYVNETVIKEQVKGLVSNQFPLDTYIFDMNWHIRPHWGAYTWDTSLYPDPKGLLAWLHQMGLLVGANLHDCDGVQPDNKLYPQMAAANGMDPSLKKPVLFNISNPTYAYSLEDIMLQPLVQMGMDFWWTDWQQGVQGVAETTGLDTTFWLNHLRFTKWERSNSHLRGNSLSRYGGLGAQRYPVGFGGDVKQSWKSLQMMVYMTATATNAAFCYWAQEMMQNMGEPELFTRVIQFGAWSPIYTNYGNKNMPDSLYLLPEPYKSAVRDALQTRNQFLPYRYTLGREAYDLGLGPLRPMYYAYPWDKQSYSNVSQWQYMVGKDIIVAPIHTPIDVGEKTAKIDVWLPYSEESRYWFDLITGAMLSGGQMHTAIATIDEIPTFFRSGSVIPMLPKKYSYQTGIANISYPAIDLVKFPLGWGGIPKTGNMSIYEDDGISVDYMKPTGYSRTWVNWVVGGSCETWEIQTLGKFPGMAEKRDYTITWLGATAPKPPIMYNGKVLPESKSKSGATPGSWWYSRDQRKMIVALPLGVRLSEMQQVKVCS